MINKDLDNQVVANTKLVHYIAQRFRRRAAYVNIDYDDVVSEGMIGLVKALKRFDESYGVSFTTFAVPTIEGEILKMFRDHNNGPKFSRAVKELGFKITGDESVEELMKVHKVKQWVAEGALEFKRNAFSTSFSKITRTSEKKNLTVEEMLGYQEDYSNLDVEEFIETLPEKPRQIVTLLLANKTQREIGAVVGCTQVHVSRHIKKIRKMYQDFLQGEVAHVQ